MGARMRMLATTTNWPMWMTKRVTTSVQATSRGHCSPLQVTPQRTRTTVLYGFAWTVQGGDIVSGPGQQSNHCGLG